MVSLTRKEAPAEQSGVQVYLGGDTSEGKRIYVGNIQYEVREEDIRDEFGKVRLNHGLPQLPLSCCSSADTAVPPLFQTSRVFSQ